MDNRTFDEILRANQGPIRDVLAGMGVAPTNVDDIAQETFLIFYQAPDKRPAEIPPMAWLKGIARNLAREHFRKQASQPRRLEWFLDAEPVATEFASLAGTSRLEALRQCLGMLGDQQREMLQRYYGSDEMALDVGSDSGRSANAFRKIMLRLRERLKECVLKRVALDER